MKVIYISRNDVMLIQTVLFFEISSVLPPPLNSLFLKTLSSWHGARIFAHSLASDLWAMMYGLIKVHLFQNIYFHFLLHVNISTVRVFILRLFNDAINRV
jgi:hypothetical protein